MIDALFSQTNYLAAKRYLDLSVARHEAVAANLAHAETPGYKRIHVDPNFEAQLQQAVATDGRAQLKQLQPRLAVDAQAVSTRKDGNTVQLERELLQMNQNVVEHALSSHLVTGRITRLRLAITGRNF